MKQYASRYLKGNLIDIGCGTKPYKDLLAPYVTLHIGVDHLASMHKKSNIDQVGTAYQIPADNASFDSAICTAVLEHLEEPEQALRECYRVLKPGGVAIYSVPFIWHLRYVPVRQEGQEMSSRKEIKIPSPRDFYRYSTHGLKYLFEKVGFQIIELKALSGFWVTFGQLFVYNLYRLNRGPLRWLRIIDAMGLSIQAVAYGLDKIDKTEQWTWMYMVIARKP